MDRISGIDVTFAPIMYEIVCDCMKLLYPSTLDKDETDEKRGIYGFAVVGLLTISFVAPMVQYFSFTKEE